MRVRGKLQVACAHCGAKVERYASQLHGERFFCSMKCKGLRHREENRVGAVEPPPVAGAAWLSLADGRFALVDEDLADEMGRYAWSGGGSKCQYAATSFGRRSVYLHQMVLPGHRVDHKNGNTLDCRRENLRPATQRQNNGNIRSRAKLSPYKGIAKNGENGWAARIRCPDTGKRLHVGQFHTPEEAARAYDDAARRIHGEFACVNFPREGERGALDPDNSPAKGEKVQ